MLKSYKYDMTDQDSKFVTVTAFNEFLKDLTKMLNNSNESIYDLFATTNTRFDSIAKRLDDLEKRINDLEKKIDGNTKTLSDIQNKVVDVKKDTALIPPIFELLELDGEDIAKLNTRIDKLAN